jgi:hypothetical protein
MAQLPDVFGRRDVRDEFHTEILKRQQYEEFERQRAAEKRAQQAAQQSAENHAQQREMHPHQVTAAQHSNTAAEQAIRDNKIKLDEAEILRTSQGDVNGWLAHKSPDGSQPYAKSFYEAPPEARAHFQNAYPTVPISQTANVWNNSVRAVTGNAMTGVPKIESEYPIERTISTNEKGESQVTQAEKAPMVRQTANVPEGTMNKLITIHNTYDKIPRLKEAYNAIRDSWLTGKGWSAVPKNIKDTLIATMGPKEYQNYEALLNDIITHIAKGIGGDTGVLSNEDKETWFKTIPSANQDPATADFLFNKMEKDIREGFNRVHDYYGRVYHMGDLPRLGEVADPAQKPKGPVNATPPKAPVRPVSKPKGQNVPQGGTGPVTEVDKLDKSLPPGRYTVKGEVSEDGKPIVYTKK